MLALATRIGPSSREGPGLALILFRILFVVAPSSVLSGAAYGDSNARTPAFDALAARSLRFERAYAHASAT